MIRFCDLREAYWTMLDGTETGPFAFIDTVTDTFVTIDGEQLFDDVDDLEHHIAREHVGRDWDRLRSKLPEWTRPRAGDRLDE